MTREEVIKTLEIIDKTYVTLYPVERKALEIAIKVLEQEPSHGPWVSMRGQKER